VSEGAAKIRASIAIPDMGEVIEQAVVDILTERSGPAFEWLSRVCERFVGLCSLGLEASSTEEIRRVIARHKVMLDSDIVITALCQGERGHGATREILSKWIRLGGRLLLPEPVLEEVAYHAYISEKDFQDTKQLAPDLKGVELRRYCSNAFVRAFYTVETDQNQWPTFRAMYAGDKPHDYSKILELMRDQMIGEFLPSAFDTDLARDIKRYLLAISSGQEQAASEYFGDPGRLGRDGQILASIAAARKLEKTVGSDSRVVLLSSSTKLRMADEKFRDQFGAPEAIISRGALSYLISLVPESGLGVGALRKALFDFGETAHLAETERFALRVIRAAGTYTMPWAQRPHLRRQLEQNIRREAEQSGVTAKQFKMKFLAGDETTGPAHLIAKTIKDMALNDPEKATLRMKVRQLEKELRVATAKVSPSPPRGRRRQRIMK
jgi:predicted nucleic acid-binding protein